MKAPCLLYNLHTHTHTHTPASAETSIKHYDFIHCNLNRVANSGNLDSQENVDDTFDIYELLFVDIEQPVDTFVTQSSDNVVFFFAKTVENDLSTLQYVDVCLSVCYFQIIPIFRQGRF